MKRSRSINAIAVSPPGMFLNRAARVNRVRMPQDYDRGRVGISSEGAYAYVLAKVLTRHPLDRVDSANSTCRAGDQRHHVAPATLVTRSRFPFNPGTG